MVPLFHRCDCFVRDFMGPLEMSVLNYVTAEKSSSLAFSRNLKTISRDAVCFNTEEYCGRICEFLQDCGVSDNAVLY